MSGVVSFAGAGSLRAAYEAVDWAATPVGPPATWSPTLHATLALALATRFPVTLLWGPELVLLYNEAYVELIDDKHPAALGTPVQKVFPEVWDAIGPLLRGVLAGEGPTWVEDARLPLQRRGFLEECFFTFSYSPVMSPDGSVAGVLDIAVETTSQVVNQRRLAMLTTLGERLRDVRTPDQLRGAALPVLRGATLDLPVVELLVPGDAPARDALLPDPPVDVPRDRPLVLTTDAGTVAWLRPRASASDSGGPTLGVRLSEHLAVDEDYLSFLGLVAAALTSAWSAACARETEAHAAAASRSMSETLQRSLLTEPPQPDHLQLAVRYEPAATDVQVGGDWYDAFLTRDGATCLAVGDVSGHDQQAAAGMGQVRNLLRGICYTIGDPPAAVLSALDLALRDLAVGVLATCVLAIVEQTPEDSAAGVRRLRWSSAGHLPPLLLHADGTAELLHTPPDLLLGLDPGSVRADHEHVLEPGTTLLLYTDGLVERRGLLLDDGLDWLLSTVEGLHGRDLEDLCDRLLVLVRGHSDDDVALLAVRAHPQDAPRPADAGPQRLPQDMTVL